ncbi:MAG: FMN-binding protein [Tetrasphaera sp.]|nr:FMN-binding protein [Tetrasphaera sp.]
MRRRAVHGRLRRRRSEHLERHIGRLGSTGSGSTDSGSTDSGTSGSGGSASAGTFTGDSVMTRWGVVQVAITVKGGKITRSEVVQVPWDNPRDQQINAYAVPILNQEVVSAQSAQIDMVSGATVTSEGYIQSLQSAIDQAHLS